MEAMFLDNLEKGDVSFFENLQKDFFKTQIKGISPFNYILARGDKNVVNIVKKILLKNKIDVNFIEEDGLNSLYYLVQNIKISIQDKLKITEYLIKQKYYFNPDIHTNFYAFCIGIGEVEYLLHFVKDIYPEGVEELGFFEEDLEFKVLLTNKQEVIDLFYELYGNLEQSN